MNATQPTNHLRRSMIYRILHDAGAHFEACAGAAAIAWRFGDGDDEAERVRRMGLADLSPLPRTGFKGKDTPQWLAAQGVVIPDAPNQAHRQDDGAVVLRLSNDEHVILNHLSTESGLPARLDEVWQLDPDRMCYHMPRAETHCWFAISGERASEMLAKVCGVDLRADKFAEGSIAQTSLARINAVIARHDLGTTCAFYVLADSASADYLWPCLIDAMREFGGDPVGLAALRAKA